jgi:hypothetical protein
MATVDQTLDAGRDLRNALFDLSQDGNFADFEQEGFARLQGFYHMTLERFMLSPAHGPASQHYDSPRDLAIEGVPLAAQCRPGDPTSQQPLYDKVHEAAAALKAVTAQMPRPLMRAPMR